MCGVGIFCVDALCSSCPSFYICDTFWYSTSVMFLHGIFGYLVHGGVDGNKGELWQQFSFPFSASGYILLWVLECKRKCSQNFDEMKILY